MSTSIENYEVVNPSPTSAGHAGRHHRPFVNEEAPRTPEMSHLSTPKMSQHNARSVVLETPPLILDTFPTPKFHLESAPSFHSDHTPDSLDDEYDQYRFDPLEPPAWRPPERDELEYVERWNMAHNNPHHYLSGYSYNNKDDSSTICSSQTGNNSLGKSYNSRDNRSQHMQTLRPRGFSITSNSYGSHSNKGHAHSRHLSFGSCPQRALPPCGPTQHHRHESLPVALFSSSSLAQSSQLFSQSQHRQNTENAHQHHPLLGQQPKEHEQQQSQARINQRTYQMIQPRKRDGPHEIHSRQHASQIRADATMAGLRGALIDLYAVDRCVDEATARMLATTSIKERGNMGRATNGQERRKPSRMTSVGTLKDIHMILELHKVDRMVDRFKQGLQMPVFFEEEAMDIAIMKELRRVDLLVEGCRRKNDKDDTLTIDKEKRINTRHNTQQDRYQFDLSDGEDEEESLNLVGGGYGDDIYLSTDSFGTVPNPDPYQFYDPHEQATVLSNSYQQSYALATSEDDLNAVMDLLRSDVEIDGASRSRKEFDMVRPLLEIDRSVERWRGWMEKKKCEKELMDLYLVDVEVDKAKRRVGSGTTKSDQVNLISTNAEGDKTKERCEVSLGSSQLVQSFTEAASLNSSKYCNVMAMPFEQTTEEIQPPCPNTPRAAPPPPSVTPECTKRSIFPHREKLNAGMLAAANNAMTAQATESSKRSIFTLKEKTAALQGSFQGQGGQ